MNRKRFLEVALVLAFVLSVFFQERCAPEKEVALAPPAQPLWFGLHVLMENKNAAEELLKEIPALARLGINLLIVEVDYNYEYVSHPELRGEDPISKETVMRRESIAGAGALSTPTSTPSFSS